MGQRIYTCKKKPCSVCNEDFVPTGGRDDTCPRCRNEMLKSYISKRGPRSGYGHITCIDCPKVPEGEFCTKRC